MAATRAAPHLGVTPGAYVLLTVADSGCGMSPRIVARAFEPFFTTKPPGQGTGMGLAITANFVQANGGTLACRSEPGKGSTFTITLPIAHSGEAS